MAYTVEDAKAALASAYADPQNDPNMVWWIQASVTITDTPPAYAHPTAEFPTSSPEGEVELAAGEVGAPITGEGQLWVNWETPDTLGNLSPADLWYRGFKLEVQRGATGPSFLLGLAIEPVYAIVGPLTLRPPAFARSFVQRHGLVRPKQYRGVLALRMQPFFTVPLTEDPVNPKLTGTITPSPYVPGAIHPPAAIEVVLESLESGIIQ